ncbi:class F sortase [Streptomyces sp. LRE541]|uniref:class F sortase n=1 Tax=Streptomyces sp. LRE541 TaxID=2931983 RepID=UPI00200EDCF3|nr:class F sortase [Streptomyces sp. LRE541]UPZ30616.1 class F sortase [Streptomyces sp. LRE541]
MTLPSRRAFVTAAMATLLVGCGGGGGGEAGGSDADRGGSASPSPGSAGEASRPAGKNVRALAHSVPVGLRIPAIGVDTPVMRLGLAPDGSVEVPPVEADDRAGWYRHSPTPGQVGPSVILGHVTVGTYGEGVFRDLRRLRRGDRIEARLENGTAAEFTVSGVRTVAQARFPTEDVYGDVGRPELRLITCGGPRSGDGYRDSVIVFAELSSSSPGGS